MTEERTTTTRTPDGNTHTTTTVTHGEPKRGGASMLFLAVIAVAAIIGVVAFTQMGGAEVAKDNAIADAATEVGDAAGQVGDAVEEVADDVTGGE